MKTDIGYTISFVAPLIKSTENIQFGKDPLPPVLLRAENIAFWKEFSFQAALYVPINGQRRESDTNKENRNLKLLLLIKIFLSRFTELWTFLELWIHSDY